MIYLVHHADAVGPDIDPQRPLSAEGRAHADRLAQQAGDRAVRPDVVWHSGKLRARQTAEAFWRACNPLAALSAVRGLQPGDPPEWVRDLVAGETREIMLVGHMPNLARVLSLLTTEAALGFPEHGLVALDAVERGYVERFRLA
jgi:phosphohistidine phosphatase